MLDRIPSDFRAAIAEVLVCDDASHDATYLVGLGYQQAAPTCRSRSSATRRTSGYGGNQKAGYRWAIEHGLDIVVLLHGDGQYAPEMLADIVAPLVRGRGRRGVRLADDGQGAARAGGMPLYKYVGNRILTTVREHASPGIEL